MNVLVCVKRVPFTGGKMVLAPDAKALETRHLGFTISPHEECGVEEAVRLIEAHGGESVVLTLGPPEAVEQLRDAMALGIERAIHLQTSGHEFDGEATAAAIATWLIISRCALPRVGRRLANNRVTVWTAGAVFLAAWLPFNNGLRPEPLIAFGALAAWMLVENAIATRRLWPAAVAVIVAVSWLDFDLLDPEELCPSAPLGARLTLSIVSRRPFTCSAPEGVCKVKPSSWLSSL